MMATVAIPVIPFCLLIFATAEADLEGRRTGLRHALLIRLAQWSYGFFYLVHQLVTRTVTDFLEHETYAPTLFAAYAASTCWRRSALIYCSASSSTHWSGGSAGVRAPPLRCGAPGTRSA